MGGGGEFPTPQNITMGGRPVLCYSKTSTAQDRMTSHQHRKWHSWADITTKFSESFCV